MDKVEEGFMSAMKDVLKGDYSILKRERKVGLSFSLDKSVAKGLKDYCDERDIFPSNLINVLIKCFLNEFANPDNSEVKE